MSLDLENLRDAVDQQAAMRRYMILQPAGGQYDKVFPPTYPQENGRARHVFENRRIQGETRLCVLIDSVASQANRLEAALVEAARAGEITLPFIETDFSDTDLADIGRISTLDAPHRAFDAIIRDSRLGEKAFPHSELGISLTRARMDRATAMFESTPNALLFGAWNSTGEGGGLGAKVPRALVSEIVGVDAQGGYKVASRIDPLAVSRDVAVYANEHRDWALDRGALSGKVTKIRPSEINHSNIAPSVDEGGVTIEYASHSAVVTLAGLRRMRFPEGDTPASAERNRAARTLLAAMGLYALAAQDRTGFALRSRCDLVPETPARFEVVAGDGSNEAFDLSLEDAHSLYEDAVAGAREAGFNLSAEPHTLTPSERLVELVRKSREKAEAGQAEPDAD
jgi:CRISPR-associated protein Csb1